MEGRHRIIGVFVNYPQRKALNLLENDLVSITQWKDYSPLPD